jgi:hypothetical protein
MTTASSLSQMQQYARNTVKAAEKVHTMEFMMRVVENPASSLALFTAVDQHDKRIYISALAVMLLYAIAMRHSRGTTDHRIDGSPLPRAQETHPRQSDSYRGHQAVNRTVIYRVRRAAYVEERRIEIHR